MNNRKKTIALFIAIGMIVSSVAHSDQIERPSKQYGALKELNIGSETTSFEIKQGSEKTTLNSRCEEVLASNSFGFLVLKNGGKKITLIVDSSGEGQNIFPTDYYVINQKCEPIGNRAGISSVANEPKGSYHLASILVNTAGDTLYLLTEEKYGPGKVCAFITDCKRVKGYVYARDLYKVTDRGLVPVLNKQKTTDKDLDIDTVIPLGLN